MGMVEIIIASLSVNAGDCTVLFTDVNKILVTGPWAKSWKSINENVHF